MAHRINHQGTYVIDRRYKGIGRIRRASGPHRWTVNRARFFRPWRSAVASARSGGPLGDLTVDLCFALCGLRRNPTFTLVTTATIAVFLLTEGAAGERVRHQGAVPRAFRSGFYETVPPVPLGTLRSLEILSMCAAKSGYPEMVCAKASRSSE